MARLIQLPLPPLRPIARPERAPGRRSSPPTRARASGTVGTLLLATLAALSMALLGGCGGGEAGDDPRAETGESATISGTNGATTAANPLGASETGGRAEASGTTGTGPAARQVAVDFRLESDYGPGEAPGGPKHGVADASAERGQRSAVPVDRHAQTRAGRYLSRAVAERLYEETGGRAVWVDAGCCAGHDPELPERIAFGMQAMLGDEAPLYVSGSDLRQAARLADRLDTLGVGRVYLVTP